MAETDYEFAQHVQTQLAFEREKLLKIKLNSLEDMRETEDNINVLEELLTPLRHSVLVAPENIYVPTALGVLSRWPWHDLLKDWLCLVVKNIHETEFEMFPFERYIQFKKMRCQLVARGSASPTRQVRAGDTFPRLRTILFTATSQFISIC